MKSYLKILASVFWIFIIFSPLQSRAQAPERLSYQAIVRDINNHLVKDQIIGMQISVIKDSDEGIAVYVETQTPTTNANGLLSIEIGTGTTSDDFSAIDWEDGPFFIKTETDPSGGTNYTIIGTRQLLSVAYALHAKSAEKVEGILMNGTEAGQMQYWDGNAWVIIPATVNEVATLQMIDGVPTWVGGTPTIPTVTSTTGRIWMDRNLGASQVATSSTDEASYGDLYQWGRGADGHQIRTSEITNTLSSTDAPTVPDDVKFILAPSSPNDWRSPQNSNLWQGVNGVNNPCPAGFRIPTNEEWDAERLSWGSNNAAGAFASPLKLPIAGSRYHSNGVIMGGDGHYWSSTVYSIYSGFLFFYDSDANRLDNIRVSGFSVRCIKD